MAGRRPSRVLPWEPFSARALCGRNAARGAVERLSHQPGAELPSAQDLRATDEQVAVAKSGLRPNISASGDAAFQNQESDIVGGSQSSSVQKCDAATAATEPAFCASLDASQANFGTERRYLERRRHPSARLFRAAQPAVFEGFQNINAIRQAKATVQAGREGLRATEQTTLLNAATAYVDVVRDQAVVKLAPDQRRRADRAAAADQGSLQCRRGDAHRRGPGRSAPVRLHHPALCRPGQPQDEPRHLRAR